MSEIQATGTVLDYIAILPNDSVVTIVVKSLFVMFTIWLSVRLLDSYRNTVKLKVEMAVGYFNVGWYGKSVWNVVLLLMAIIYTSALVYTVMTILTVFIKGASSMVLNIEYLVVSVITAGMIAAIEIVKYVKMEKEV